MEDIKTCYRCSEPLFDSEEHLCTVETPEEEDIVPVWEDEKEKEKEQEE